MQCSQQSASPHLGAQQTQLVFARSGKLDIVYAHDLHALRVHDLLVHDIACQQHLVGLQIGEANIGRGIFEIHAVIVKMVDVFTPRDHEGRLGRALEGQRRNTREDLARGDAQVVDDAHFFTRRVDNGQFEHFGEIVHSAPMLVRSLRRKTPRERMMHICSCRPYAKVRRKSPHARVFCAAQLPKSTRRG